MSTVIFACKSNSCRSQMAEGWAQEWIRNQKDEFGEKLKALREENDKVKDQCLAIERTISIIDNFLIASVALDSSAVFTTESAQPSLEIQTPPQRKSVKSKAVAAMAEDGVDISRYIPMTVNELLLTLDDKHIFEGDKQTSDGDRDRMISAQQYNAEIKSSPLTNLKSSGEILSIEEEKCHFDDPFIDKQVIGGNMAKFEEEKSQFNDPLINNQVTDGVAAKIDHLIVLCSCGDNMKDNLMRRSKYVEEWDIEPPTAAAKSGEGDGAYRRVSLEIREEVNSMMEGLLGTVLA
mmetsp:Transcript_35093/g.41881  ORF Transcript_35093/g.41881 Transcript_35093/m.41881 type:complete len:292 (-) Transcript_35093:70-945(-)